MDSLLACLLYLAVQEAGPQSYFLSLPTSFLLFFVWLTLMKTIKHLGYFFHYPADLKFLPVLYTFSYLHGFIYFYSFFTLPKTGWCGGRGSLTDGEKQDEDELRIAASDDIELGLAYAGLGQARCSGIDIHLLGDKVMGLTCLSHTESPASHLHQGEK
ncbi:MAG: hypothetical protein Q9213_004044 [Squamulea squamosa]